MNFLGLFKGFVQLVILLSELAPSMIKLWRAWEERHGKELTSAERRRLADTMKAAVKTKDTSDLEAFLTGKNEVSK